MFFTIDSPIVELSALGTKDVKAYFSWFLSIIPRRLEALSGAVVSTPGFEKWEANFTPKSLEMLGAWFAMQVKTRKRTQREIDKILMRSPYLTEIPEELTDHTFGVVHDVAIYFAEVLRHQYPALNWQQITGTKRNVVYGYAALSGFGKLDFAPVHLVSVLAYGIAQQKWNGRRLGELYEIWSKLVNVPSNRPMRYS